MSTFETWGVTTMVADESPSCWWVSHEDTDEEDGPWSLIVFRPDQAAEVARQWGVPDDEAPCGAIVHNPPGDYLVVAWFQTEPDLLRAAWAERADAAGLFDAYREQMGES